jgi:Bacterial Ig domain/Bacterial cadherin-like domain
MNKIAAYAIFYWARTGFNAQAEAMEDVAIQDLTPIPRCALTSGGFGAVLGGALGAAPRAGVAVYENAPRVVENLLKKLGEVVGLAPSKSKTVISEAATSELSAAVKVSTPKSAGAGVEVRLRDANVPELAGSTEILIKGKVVVITPAASSKTINEAAIWYRAELNKRASAIDKTLPLEAQIIQAETLAQELMNGATASLFDKELAATLRESFARPSIEKLKNEIGGAGEKQLQAVLAKATASTDKTRQWFEAGACFVAGTQVHTKEGLVPIEKLKIGDWVLSRPENSSQGSELAYKRVLKTFVHHDKEIHQVRAYDRQNYNAGGAKFMEVYCTLDHPFWVDEYGWTAASQIPGMYGSAKFQMFDGGDAWGEHNNVYQTGKDGIVWMGAGWQGHGALWSFIEQRWLNTEPIYFSEPYPELTWPWDEEFEVDGEGLIYKTTVYNIEVEDYHTYFVGEKGVWVHNANCDISLFGKNGQKPDPKLLGDYHHFASEKELIAFFKTNPESRGFAIVPVPGAAKYVERPVGELKRNLVFEDGVTGRIDINGMRQEFAVLFLNSNKAPQARNYIRVEGQEFSQTGVRIFIDRKRELIKLGEFLGDVKNLDILWRVTQALEQNKNYRWAFEFEANLINGAEKVAFERAKAWLEKIKRNEPDGPKFVDAKDGNVLTDSADRLERIRKMLNGYIDETGAAVGPKIEFRNQGVVTTFPQNVLTEGSTTTASLTLAQINALLPQARQYWLAAGASASLLGSASFQIDDLPFGLAGQSQGNVITLDASGAGWGWFVDSTPMDQAEFDAGASATSFTSSTSSPATGKLDLLTVLIHELGHIVSLPSTATANDVMSQYLAPSQRRLPNAVDIAALQAKGSPHYSNGTSVTMVAPPASYGGSLSYGQLHPAAPVINPTLTNGNFTPAQNGTVSQWETTGKVDATPSTITLGETTKAQAHLAQAFVLSAQDRFLTFTVSGLNLQSNSTTLEAAPQDAFEVALRNANTDANLLATGTSNLGTSRSDALLNVQLASSAIAGSSSTGAALQERAASGLLHTDNPDGSRTYVLDLSGIAAGNGGSNAGLAVNLSFDLIGFGLSASQLGSRVNISDVRLISTPLAVADTATLAEDGSTTITVQANDLNASAVGFAPRLVASAQHGQVSLSAPVGVPGVFSGFVYTPDANYFGTDSFTYQYSNAAGTELSNTTTVSLTVTAVNDAPVAYDVPVTMLEDNAVTINLVAADVDTAGTSLVFGIQRQPPVHASC